MNTTSRIIYWIPRVLGIALFLFIGMFATDAFGPGLTYRQQIAAFIVNLVPAFAVLLVVLVAWKWEYIGGTILVLLAMIYAINAFDHLSWILFVSGPIALVGVMFMACRYLQNKKEVS